MRVSRPIYRRSSDFPLRYRAAFRAVAYVIQGKFGTVTHHGSKLSLRGKVRARGAFFISRDESARSRGITIVQDDGLQFESSEGGQTHPNAGTGAVLSPPDAGERAQGPWKSREQLSSSNDRSWNRRRSLLESPARSGGPPDKEKCGRPPMKVNTILLSLRNTRRNVGKHVPAELGVAGIGNCTHSASVPKLGERWALSRTRVTGCPAADHKRVNNTLRSRRMNAEARSPDQAVH